ncbi:MAG: spore coat protein CotJB [Eubacteriales bacterium]
MTETERCGKRVTDYAYPFAQWDLRLYLDTHPDDKEALACFYALCGEYPTGICYGTNGGTNAGFREKTCDRWHWIDGPWPWEYEANTIEGNICGGRDRGASCPCEKGGR